MIKRISLRLAVASMATVTMVAMTTSSAHATGDAGKFNMWEHDAYKGQHESRWEYDSNLHNDSCPGCDPGPGGNFGDDMSSFVNNSDYWFFIYKRTSDGSGYGPDKLFCVRPRSKDGNLGNNGYSDLEDEISSLVRSHVKGTFSEPHPNVNITCKNIIGHRI